MNIRIPALRPTQNNQSSQQVASLSPVSSLNQGDTLRGMVVDVGGEHALIRLSGGGTLMAQVGEGVQVREGDMIELTVTGREDGRTIMRLAHLSGGEAVQTAALMDAQVQLGLSAPLSGDDMSARIATILREYGVLSSREAISSAKELMDAYSQLDARTAAFLVANGQSLIDGKTTPRLDALVDALVDARLAAGSGGVSEINPIELFMGALEDAAQTMPAHDTAGDMSAMFLAADNLQALDVPSLEEVYAQLSALEQSGQETPLSQTVQNAGEYVPVDGDEGQTVFIQSAVAQETTPQIPSPQEGVPQPTTRDETVVLVSGDPNAPAVSLSAQEEGLRGQTITPQGQESQIISPQSQESRAISPQGREGAAISAQGQAATASGQATAQDGIIAQNTMQTETPQARETVRALARYLSQSAPQTARALTLMDAMPRAAEMMRQAAQMPKDEGREALRAFVSQMALPPDALDAFERADDALRMLPLRQAPMDGEQTAVLARSIAANLPAPGMDDARAAAELNRAVSSLLTNLSTLKSALQGSPAQEAAALAARADARASALPSITQFAYMQVPVQMFERRQTAELYVMQRRRKQGEERDEYTIAIALETENMGRVEAIVRARARDVDVTFRMAQGDAALAVQSGFGDLEEALLGTGFRLKSALMAQLDKPLTPQTFQEQVRQDDVTRYALDVLV